MKIEELQKTDKGRWVFYTPLGQPHITDMGRIKAWNNTYVWVVFAFTQRPDWDTGDGERTAMACDPATLIFIEKAGD
jgi:hypothetical protein